MPISRGLLHQYMSEFQQDDWDELFRLQYDFPAIIETLFDRSGLSDDAFDRIYWPFFTTLVREGWRLERIVDDANWALSYTKETHRPAEWSVHHRESIDSAFAFAAVVVSGLNRWAYDQIIKGHASELWDSTWILSKLESKLSPEGLALLTRYPVVYNDLIAYYRRSHTTVIEQAQREVEEDYFWLWTLYDSPSLEPRSYKLGPDIPEQRHSWSTPNSVGSAHLQWLCRRLESHLIESNTATAPVHVVCEHYVFVEFPRAFEVLMKDTSLKPSTVRNQLTRDGVALRSASHGVFHKARCGGRLCRGFLYPDCEKFNLVPENSQFIKYDYTQLASSAVLPRSGARHGAQSYPTSPFTE